MLTRSPWRTCGKLNKEILRIIFQTIMVLNSKSCNSSIFYLGARYFVLLEKMLGARMVPDTSVHQIFRALYFPAFIANPSKNWDLAQTPRPPNLVRAGEARLKSSIPSTTQLIFFRKTYWHRLLRLKKCLTFKQT